MTCRRSVALAVVLWLVFAFVVWNVVFDRMVVLAGRRYSHDAVTLYRSTGRYLLIDDVMRPAVVHAVRVASAVGGGTAVVGLMLVGIAANREKSTVLATETRRPRTPDRINRW
jgi:hypothetical protein